MKDLQHTDSQKTWLGRGWAFPVVIDPRSGDIATAQYEADVRQSIQIILGTARGERVMRPDFGCGIHDLVYDAMDTALVTRIETGVREALSRYEARVEVLNVSVDTAGFIRGELVVQLEYRVRMTNQRHNLVYPFHFREGGVAPRGGGEA
jgi:phage baseplate assembly protein W